MNCYAGLAKRIVKSCFPQVVPVPQLEPLDASKISKQEACVALSDISQKKLMNQQTYWTHECLFNPKPISDEEVWAATLAWAEAKAQEREAVALKVASQTNTDESYDSDDSEFGVSIQPVLKKGISLFGDDSDEDLSSNEDASESDDDEEFPLAVPPRAGGGTILEEKKMWSLSDAAAASAMWRDDAVADAYESVAVSKAIEALDKQFPSPRKYKVATIIQATERGRALRAWKAQFTDELARDMSHIWRARYHTRMGMEAVEQQLAEQWMVSPKCVKAWILLGEQRSASADLQRVSGVKTPINHSVLKIHCIR